MKKRIIVIFFLISSLQGLKSQIFQESYQVSTDTTLSAGDLFLDLPLSTFFYNNEYFNPFYKGYTLIGANARPQLVYQSNNRLRFSAGIDLNRFYGDNEKTEATPLLSIEYSPSKNLSILMGSFAGGENHRLNEAMFSFENHLTDITENGIFINYANSHIQSQTWLNWESFIMPGDTFQEKFTAGSSNRLSLFNNNSLKISVPFSLLSHHAGGQINNNNQHVETLINISEGVKLYLISPANSLNSIFTEFTVYHSLGDFKPSPGIAFSAKMGILTNHFELNGEYFRGDKFVSFAGNPLFRSWKATGDPLEPFVYGGTREMINFKAGFRQKTGTRSFLFLRFEGYYFTDSSKLDYSYSLHFQVNDFLRLRRRN